MASCGAYVLSMKWFASALIVAVSLLASPVTASPKLCNSIVVMLWKAEGVLFPESDRPLVTPVVLAAAWLPLFERLNNAIPSLSPRETQWLKEERQASDAQRSHRALRSREYALQEAKRNADVLLSQVRQLTEKRDTAAQTRGWLMLADILIEPDADHYLARLVEERVVDRKALPWHWPKYWDTFDDIKMSIRGGRTRDAQDILRCALPSVLGVSLYD
jgi:hypothetical protein